MCRILCQKSNSEACFTVNKVYKLDHPCPDEIDDLEYFKDLVGYYVMWDKSHTSVCPKNHGEDQTIAENEIVDDVELVEKKERKGIC